MRRLFAAMVVIMLLSMPFVSIAHTGETPVIIHEKGTYTSEQFALDTTFEGGFYPPRGMISWKFWFEPVDDEIEPQSKHLKVYIERKLDEGPWEKVLTTFAPRIKPTVWKIFKDNFLHRKLTQEEIDIQLAPLRQTEKEYKENYPNNPHDPWWIAQTERDLKEKQLPRNYYRFVVENTNDHKVYLYKRENAWSQVNSNNQRKTKYVKDMN
jgi:hypothetical protein